MACPAQNKSSNGSTPISISVRIVPTDIGIDQQRRLEEGRSIRGLGEQAAIEALERFLRSDPDPDALLLFEDTDIGRRQRRGG